MYENSRSYLFDLLYVVVKTLLNLEIVHVYFIVANARPKTLMLYL